MAELRINPDKVCDFIEVAREVLGKVESTAGDHTTDGDDSPLAFMEDNGETDPREVELVDFVAALDVDEQTDLLALIYLGRGDAVNWDEAVDMATDRLGMKDPADFRVSDPLLPEYLNDALEELGESCDDR